MRAVRLQTVGKSIFFARKIWFGHSLKRIFRLTFFSIFQSDFLPSYVYWLSIKEIKPRTDALLFFLFPLPLPCIDALLSAFTHTDARTAFFGCTKVQ